MIRTLSNTIKQYRVKFRIPKIVQDIFPMRIAFKDGIFMEENGLFSIMLKFEDINYAVASREDKEMMFLKYSDLLNSLDSGATTKITINNRKFNKTDFEEKIMMKFKGDGLDDYRSEYNRILLDKATGANAIVQDKYITISVHKKNIEEARN